MKKIIITMLAAIALISCGNSYEGKTVSLTNLNDSMNYALGLVNGSYTKMYFRNDTTAADYAEFIDALTRGYEGKVEVLSEAGMAGQNLGYSIKQAEENGLADNPAWAINQKVFFQGLVNGMHQDTTIMDRESAMAYWQNEYQNSMVNDSIEPAKVVKSKCVNKVKQIALNNQNDSLNYAFGYLNGHEVAIYVLLLDSTGQLTKEFVSAINDALKSSYKHPQIVKQGEQIGKAIKDQEPNGLINEPSLITDFELIKQGFINALMGHTEQMTPADANQYISTTLNHIKYGSIKEDGEKFLAENALKEGVIVTESGLQYEVITMGKGKKPAATDRVKVHYHGTLIDGTVFDSSVERGEPIVFGLNQVIAGWTEGVQLMPVGSKFRFYIPQELGYGSRQAGEIPPYSTLIFEVELIGIEK